MENAILILILCRLGLALGLASNTVEKFEK